MNNSISDVKVPETWDSKTDKTISTLHPSIRVQAANFVNDLDNKYNIKYRIYSGLRTIDEQQDLYDKGRTKEGNIVTNAKPLQSYHNFGLAFDGVEIQNGKAIWNNPKMSTIASVGKKYGFDNGASWGDSPHFEIRKYGHHTDLKDKYLSGNFIDKTKYLKLT